MNKKELLGAMRKAGMSGVVVKRMDRMMERFATLEAFFTASSGDLMKAFAAMTPGGKKGLGKSFWASFDKAAAIYRGIDKGVEEEETPKAMEPEVHEASPKEMRMISLEELQKVVSFMELCDVEAINILEIVGFLGAVKLRQKKPDALALVAQQQVESK